MKQTGSRFPLLARLALLSLWLVAGPSTFAQTAPLAYSGRLTEKGSPATGTYEMEFKLFDTPDAGTGTQQGATLANPAVAAKDGVFTATLDFGVAVFDGSPRYLEISVKQAGSANPLSTLTPRQAITPVPYAIHTLSAVPASGGVQADANGNIAIGTNTSPPDVRLNVVGATRIAAGGTGGFLQVGTPGGETGLSILGENRADLRFNGHTLTLGTGPNAGPTPYQNGIVINTNGNVGVGMGSPFPASLWKLEVNGGTRITPGGSGGAIQFSTPNFETGMSILGANRADVRFDGSTLKLVAGPGRGPPGNASGVAIHTAGNVGIGTDFPLGKLDVRSSPGNTGIGIDGTYLYGASGNLGVGTVTPVATVHAQTPGANKAAIYGKATGPGGVGIVAASDNGPALRADGNASQARESGGFVKAMAYVKSDGTILRSFNPYGTTTVNRAGIGGYVVDFGFRVNDRFYSVTPFFRTSASDGAITAGFSPAPSPTAIGVVMANTEDSEFADWSFMIIVF